MTFASRSAARPDVVDDERLGDEVADRLLRVERLVRVLEDELDPPPVAAQLLLAPQRADVGALEVDPAGRLAGELDDDPPGRRLATARLADQREDLALDQRQVDAVDRPDDALRPAPDEVEQAAVDREMDRQAGQLDDRAAARGHVRR